MMNILTTTWSFLVVTYSKCHTQGTFITYCYHITRPFALWELGNRDKLEQTEVDTDSFPSLT